jgi:hypothetical protein
MPNATDTLPPCERRLPNHARCLSCVASLLYCVATCCTVFQHTTLCGHVLRSVNTSSYCRIMRDAFCAPSMSRVPSSLRMFSWLIDARSRESICRRHKNKRRFTRTHTLTRTHPHARTLRQAHAMHASRTQIPSAMGACTWSSGWGRARNRAILRMIVAVSNDRSS